MLSRKLSIASAILAIALPMAAHADEPGKHPGYLHALSDLRAARWNLEHRPGDATVSGQEDVAVTEVDQAIRELKKAAVEDEKNLADRPHEDAKLDHSGRLHHAAELLKAARADIHREEDNPEVRELRNQAFHHIDEAEKATVHAIRDVEHGA